MPVYEAYCMQVMEVCFAVVAQSDGMTCSLLMAQLKDGFAAW